MVVPLCGAEIFMISNETSFFLILYFSIATMLVMTFIIRNCELALTLDRKEYTSCS